MATNEVKQWTGATFRESGASIAQANTADTTIASGVEKPGVVKPAKISIDLHEYKPDAKKLGLVTLSGSISGSVELEPKAGSNTELGTDGKRKASVEAEQKLKVLKVEPTVSEKVELTEKGITVNVSLKLSLGEKTDLAGFELSPPDIGLIVCEYKEGKFEPLAAKWGSGFSSPVLGQFMGYEVKVKGKLSLTLAPDYKELLKRVALRLVPALGMEGALLMSGAASTVVLLYAWSQSTKPSDWAEELANGCYDYVNGYAWKLRSEKSPAYKSKSRKNMASGEMKGTAELEARAKALNVPTGAVAAIMKQQGSLAPDLWEKTWPVIRAKAIADWKADWKKYGDVKLFEMITKSYTYHSITSGGKPEWGTPVKAL